jgi:hypothetical protein
VLCQQPGDLEQDLAALRGRHQRPGGIGRPGGLDRGIDIGRSAGGELADHLIVIGGAHAGEGGA